MTEEDKYKTLIKKHHQLRDNWKQDNKPCIICGTNSANEGDHLPPKVLYPKSLRDSRTEFFKFPVCSECNRGSADADFLFSVLMCFSLNQPFYLKETSPIDPDLLALDDQIKTQLNSEKEGKHRLDLLNPYSRQDPKTGKTTINTQKLPVNKTITKIVKSIYWLHTNGDILQNYNPGWWILPDIDTTRKNFVEKHLRSTNHDLQWENKFISRYTMGLSENGCGGFISCSLHFYTKKKLGYGNNWLVIASPKETKVEKKSLYDVCVSQFGSPTIYPK